MEDGEDRQRIPAPSDFISEFAQVTLPVLKELAKHGARFSEDSTADLKASFKVNHYAVCITLSCNMISL